MNAFLKALQNNSPRIPEAPKVESLPKPHDNNGFNNPPELSQLIITVELVLDRKRLDVFFSQKPSSAMLASLHAWGFHYRPSDKAWYHKDTPENRQFCVEQFNAFFGDDETTQVTDDLTQNESPASVTLTTKTHSPIPQIPIANYEVFRQQTDELIAHLNISPSDLMLFAVDALHKTIFSKDS